MLRIPATQAGSKAKRSEYQKNSPLNRVDVALVPELSYRLLVLLLVRADNVSRSKSRTQGFEFEVSRARCEEQREAKPHPRRYKSGHRLPHEYYAFTASSPESNLASLPPHQQPSCLPVEHPRINRDKQSLRPSQHLAALIR
jgi:hypothetical protein